MRDRLLPALGRVAFVLLSAAVLIVFSEKMFWYVTGYSFLDLLLGYFFPTFALLWVIDAFRVRRLAPLFLVGAMFGFLAEGMLVGTLYEGGPLNWFSVSYTSLACSLEAHFGSYSVDKFLQVFLAIKRMCERAHSVSVPQPLLISNDITKSPDFAEDPDDVWKGWIDCGYWGRTENLPGGVKAIFFCKKWSDFNLTARWTNIMHEMTHAANVGGHVCSFDCKASGDSSCPLLEDKIVRWRCNGVQATKDLVAKKRWDILLVNSDTYTGWISRFWKVIELGGHCWPKKVFEF